MFINKGITFKLILFFSVSTMLIFFLIMGAYYQFTRKMVVDHVQIKAGFLVVKTVNRIESVLRTVQDAPEDLGQFLEEGTYNEEELHQFLRRLVARNDNIYGSAIAFEPYVFKKGLRRYGPYYHKVGRGIVYSDLAAAAYDYSRWDWYQIPKALGRPVWSEPYYDKGGGNILMTTYSVPFYKTTGRDRRLMGIVTADVSLDWLQQAVSSIKILKTGYGFLISGNGTFVTHPRREFIMNETIFGIAKMRGDPELREIGRRMIRGETGLAPFKSGAEQTPCMMYYAPIPASGWSLAVVFPKDELMADMAELNRTILILGLAGFLLLPIAVVLIARSITKPLRAMASATGEIAAGNLDVEMPATPSRDEVGQLSRSFAFMRTSLKAYILELTEATAARERIESELKIAHDIQMSILPKMFPPFPDRPEIDIYAIIEPARDVGGDFYDFFQIDDEHLCFVMADVSGKGIPASLFMAVTKTLIKAKTGVGDTPDEILAKVNDELCIGNDSSMFVTIFCGILNMRTGEVLFANGGHNPPLVVDPGGEVTWLEGSDDIMVGVFAGFSYHLQRLTLAPGEFLFLYTDGVTEAMNIREELFSEARFFQETVDHKDQSIRAVIDDVMAGIKEFTQGTPQSDDITMMIVQYRGFDR